MHSLRSMNGPSALIEWVMSAQRMDTSGCIPTPSRLTWQACGLKGTLLCPATTRRVGSNKARIGPFHPPFQPTSCDKRPQERSPLARCAIPWSLHIGLSDVGCRRGFRHRQQGTIQTPRPSSAHLMHHSAALADHAVEKGLHLLVSRPLLGRFLDALRKILRRKGPSRSRGQAFLQHLLSGTLRRFGREDRRRSRDRHRHCGWSRGWAGRVELVFRQECPDLAHHFEVRHELSLQFRQGIGSEIRRSHGEKDVHFSQKGKWKSISPFAPGMAPREKIRQQSRA